MFTTGLLLFVSQSALFLMAELLFCIHRAPVAKWGVVNTWLPRESRETGHVASRADRAGTCKKSLNKSFTKRRLVDQRNGNLWCPCKLSVGVAPGGAAGAVGAYLGCRAHPFLCAGLVIEQCGAATAVMRVDSQSR